MLYTLVVNSAYGVQRQQDVGTSHLYEPSDRGTGFDFFWLAETDMVLSGLAGKGLGLSMVTESIHCTLVSALFCPIPSTQA